MIRGWKGAAVGFLGLTGLYLLISSKGAANRVGTIPVVAGSAARRWLDPVSLFPTKVTNASSSSSATTSSTASNSVGIAVIAPATAGPVVSPPSI